MSRWVVIGAGHSISEAPLELPAADRVVAMNRAYYRYPGADIWSVAEHPDNMLGGPKTPYKTRHARVVTTRKLLVKHSPTIWAPAGPGAHAWCDEFEGLARIEQYTFIEDGKPSLGPPWPTKVVWRTCTLMATLARILQKGGKYIGLVGVDLEGVGGHLNPSKAPKVWEARWAEERSLLESAIAECAAHGVEVDWRRAEVEV